jgi:hypothetical protein
MFIKDVAASVHFSPDDRGGDQFDRRGVIAKFGFIVDPARARGILRTRAASVA